MAQYSLDDKIRALDALWDADGNISATARATGYPKGALRRWRDHESDLRRAYVMRLQTASTRKMLNAQHQMAEKALQLIGAMTGKTIHDAPLNQLTSALGTLVDRYLKLQEMTVYDEQLEQVVRFEFRHPDGSLQSSPYWATDDRGTSSAVQSRGLRSALGQDRTGEDYINGESLPSWSGDVVAGTDLRDGDAGLARFEDDDSEPDWSPR